MRDLRYPKLWLAVGWFGIALLIYLSLTTLKVDIHGSDKLAHLLAYTLLMGWFVQLYRGRTALFYAVGLVALGTGLEFLQQMTGRYFELADMVANILGVTIGLLLGHTPLARVLLRLERALSR